MAQHVHEYTVRDQKLSQRQRAMIQALDAAGFGKKELALQFGVTSQCVEQIVAKRWTNGGHGRPTTSSRVHTSPKETSRVVTRRNTFAIGNQVTLKRAHTYGGTAFPAESQPGAVGEILREFVEDGNGAVRVKWISNPRHDWVGRISCVDKSCFE